MAVFGWSITVKDGKGKRSVTTGNMNVADLATAEATLLELGSRMRMIITGRIEEMTISRRIAPPGIWPAAPDPASDVEIKAQFAYYCANNKITRVGVPTFNRTLMRPASDDVNTDHGDVDDFQSYLITNGFTDTNNSDITSLKSAKEAFGRR